MEEVVEHKERELWTLRTERDKLLGIGLAGCSVEELEELESEMIRTLVRIKSIKKKKLKEDRDSTKIDLLQVLTSQPSTFFVVSSSSTVAAGSMQSMLLQRKASRVPALRPLRSMRGVRLQDEKLQSVPAGRSGPCRSVRKLKRPNI